MWEASNRVRGNVKTTSARFASVEGLLTHALIMSSETYQSCYHTQIRYGRYVEFRSGAQSLSTSAYGCPSGREAAAQNRDNRAFANNFASHPRSTMTASPRTAQLLSAMVFVFTVVGLPWGSDVTAQSLPGWAESQDTRGGVTEPSPSRYEHRGRRPTRSTHADGQQWGASQSRRGGFRTRAPGGVQGPPQGCSTSRDCSGYPNAYCGKNRKCFPNGSGPGNQEGSGQRPTDVPIGKHGVWLVLLGLGYGVRRLRSDPKGPSRFASPKYWLGR